MLRPLHAITGMRIDAKGDDLGHVHDIYFDDSDWRVRYFHVDTRPWFHGRHVLLAPAAVRSVDWDGGRLDVAITREEVRSSPGIDSHKPVSRQHDSPWFGGLQWPLPSPDSLWEGEELAAKLHTLLIEMHAQGVTPSPEPTKDDPHLWSAGALHHYGVEDDHGELGRVDDLLVDPDAWTLRYIAVQKGGPLHVNQFLVPVDTVQWISWDTKRVRVALGGETNGGADRSRETTVA